MKVAGCYEDRRKEYLTQNQAISQSTTRQSFSSLSHCFFMCFKFTFVICESDGGEQ